MTLVNLAFGHEVANSVILAIGGDKFGAILVNCPETELRIASEKFLETAATRSWKPRPARFMYRFPSAR